MGLAFAGTLVLPLSAAEAEAAFPAALLLQLTRALLAQASSGPQPLGTSQTQRFHGATTPAAEAAGLPLVDLGGPGLEPTWGPHNPAATAAAHPDWASAAASDIWGPKQAAAFAAAVAASAAKAEAESPERAQQEVPSVSYSVPDERETTSAADQRNRDPAASASASAYPIASWRHSSTSSREDIQQQRGQARAAAAAAVAAAVEAAAMAGVAAAAAFGQQHQQQQQPEQRQVLLPGLQGRPTYKRSAEGRLGPHGSPVSSQHEQPQEGPPESATIIRPSASLSPLSPRVLAALASPSGSPPRMPLVRPESPLDRLGPLASRWAFDLQR